MYGAVSGPLSEDLPPPRPVRDEFARNWLRSCWRRIEAVRCRSPSGARQISTVRVCSNPSLASGCSTRRWPVPFYDKLHRRVFERPGPLETLRICMDHRICGSGDPDLGAKDNEEANPMNPPDIVYWLSALIAVLALIAAGVGFLWRPPGRALSLVARRYRETQGEYILNSWSTPMTEYGTFGSLRLPIAGVGVWQLPQGDLSYLELHISEIAYNVPVPAF